MMYSQHASNISCSMFYLSWYLEREIAKESFSSLSQATTCYA